MIIDSIDRLKEYATLNPLFPKVIEYIESLDFDNLKMGKVELDGQNLFAIVSDSTLKTPEEVKLEVHNDYIDIQLPVSRSEEFGWAPRALLTKEVAAFDTTKDIQFFHNHWNLQFNLTPGNFVMFFPQDAHAPCLGEGTVIKIVIKIKANF